MNSVVNVFILVIVLVFDPLAICMVLGYNFLVKREKQQQQQEPETTVESPKHFAVYNDPPPERYAVPVSKPVGPALDPVDPYPQYMTKEETEAMLDRWWAKRNGVAR